LDRIRIELLGIRQYRNYESLEIQLHNDFNIITGLNGAGKTSILDAIYYLTNGKSYFSYQDQFLYLHGTSSFILKGKILSGDDKYDIDIKSAAGTKKKINVDDKSIESIIEYVGRFPSFMIAPKDILILVESSIERRKVMNRTLSQVDRTYFRFLLQYNKLLKQRNAALKRMREIGKRDDLLLESINSNMIEPANYIFQTRRQYVAKIGPLLQKYYETLSNGAEIVRVNYKSHLLEADMLGLLEQSADRDYYTTKTSKGIHKDDLEITINDVPIKKYASQGQLKSAIIALKLSQLLYVRNITNKMPILLLDDIFDKLDTERVEKFIHICHDELQAQVFITDTDENRVEERLKKLNIDYKGYHIKDGQLIL